jgi:hypothetical protein
MRRAGQRISNWSLAEGCGPSDDYTKKAAFLRPLKRGVGRDRTADTRIFSPLLYRLSYRTSFPDFWFGVAKIGFPGKIPKFPGSKSTKNGYIPYSLKNLIRMIFSCSQVKLLSDSSCCATCRLLVSQLLKYSMISSCSYSSSISSTA